MKVVLKKPNKGFEAIEIENTIDGIRKAVGCEYINAVILLDDLVVFFDRDMRVNGSPYNCEAFGTKWYGTMLFCGIGNDGFADMPDSIKWRNKNDDAC